MHVQRVQTERGSRIVPPLDSTWGPTEKLEWHAAVVATDSGLFIDVRVADFKTQVLGRWRQTPGHWFDVVVGSSVCGPMTFDRAWGYLNGVDTGARASAGAERRA